MIRVQALVIEVETAKELRELTFRLWSNGIGGQMVNPDTLQAWVTNDYDIQRTLNIIEGVHEAFEEDREEIFTDD